MQQIESVKMLNSLNNALHLQQSYHVPSFSKVDEKPVFRQCTPEDLLQILAIRAEFPMGNGGGLKYCDPGNIPFHELYGIFYQGFLVGISRISICDFYYYRLKANKLYLEFIPHVAYMSSIYVYPVFRKRYSLEFLLWFYRIVESFGYPIISELRGIYDEQQESSVFWNQYLTPYLGNMKYKEYLEYIRYGEIAIIEKLPKVLKIQKNYSIGQFHDESNTIKVLNIRKGYKPIGYSNTTATPIYLKDL